MCTHPGAAPGPREPKPRLHPEHSLTHPGPSRADPHRARLPAWDPHPTLPPVALSLGGLRCRRQGCPCGSLPALMATGRSPAPRVSLPECLPSSSTRANTATTRLLTTAPDPPQTPCPAPCTPRLAPAAGRQGGAGSRPPNATGGSCSRRHQPGSLCPRRGHVPAGAGSGTLGGLPARGCL